MKLLAVASRERLKSFPQVPTMAETLPGFEADTWMGVVAPPGTPTEITRKLSDAIAGAFRRPNVNARIAALAVEPRHESGGNARPHPAERGALGRR